MKTRNLILLMAACIMSAACNETVEINVTPSEPLVTLNFTSVKPEVSNQTKTEYVDGHILWSKTSDEKIRVALADNDVLNVGDKFYVSNKADISDDAKVATFPAGSNIAGVVEAGHEYVAYALYPASASSKTSLDYELNPASVSVTLPTTQESTLTSYNGAGDIMVGISTDFISTLTSTDPVSLNWKRLVAINKVTLTNVGVDDGEKILSVTFTAPTNVYLSGAGYVNLSAQTLTTSGSSQNSVKVVLPDGADASAFDVWFTSFETAVGEGEDLTVVVETDLATYTRTITARAEGICFFANYLNKLRVDMSTAVREAKAIVDLGLSNGDYVILIKSGTNYYAVQADGGTAYCPAVSVDAPADPATSYTTDDPSLVWTLTKDPSGDGYSIKNESKYIQNATSNAASLGNDAYFFEITKSDDLYNIHGGNTSTPRLLAYNSSSPRFAFYAASTATGTGYVSNLYIIPADLQVDPEIVVSSPAPYSTEAINATIKVTYKYFTGTPTAQAYDDEECTTACTWLTVSVNGEGNLEISAEANTNEESREAWIKITAGVTTKNIRVSQNGTGTSAIEPKEVTFDFTAIDGLSSWGTGYSQRDVEYTEATVTFVSASKQTSTITDQPVTKGSDVIVVMKDSQTINSLTLTCTQWRTKTQTITLNTSTDGGVNFTSTDTNSSNFTLSASDLSGVNAVKFTFSSSNQVGIQSLVINYNPNN